MTIDMNSRRDSDSTIIIDRTLTFKRLPSPFKRMFEMLTHYDTPKVVRFESKWIASLSLIVKLSLAIGCVYLMCQRDSYQKIDRSPISAVTIKVKPASFCLRNASTMGNLSHFNCTQSVYDVNDFIVPATENSAVSITTRITETEHVLRFCDNTTVGKYSSIYATSLHDYSIKARRILPPFYRPEYENENETIIPKTQLCWFKLPVKNDTKNYQALDYILFIKHFVEFPELRFMRNNLVGDIVGKSYIKECEYDREHHPLCPKFRILKILETMGEKPEEYEAMFHYGSLIEIKITWKCNLDRRSEYCEPLYEFARLDLKPYQDNPYDPGSNFLTSRHYFRPNDRQLHRIHTTIYNLHIVVSVTGEVGKFDLSQTTTSIGSFLGIIAMGTIVCDLMAAFFTNLRKVKYDS